MAPADLRRRAALAHLVRLGVLPLSLAAPLAPALTTPARAQARPTGRVALVVGNAAYPGDAALRNPVNDAQAMAALLQRLGFEVVQARDASRTTMREATVRAASLLSGAPGGAPGGGLGRTGLLYYAGHGVQVGQRNFMMPVDHVPAKEADVMSQAVDVGEVVEAFRRAGTQTNVVVLDACRDNPFAEPGAARGLAPIDAPPNTFLAYATAPGNVAEDGTATEGNGLYTGFLLKELQRPGARVEDVFKRVRLGVRQASQGRQVPWESTSLEGDFFFDPQPPAPLPVPEADALELAERTTWQRMRGNARAEDLFAFLLVFPQGKFAEQALFLLNLRQQLALAAVDAPLSSGPAQGPGVAASPVAPAAAPAPRPAPAATTGQSGTSSGYDSGYGAPAPAPRPAPVAPRPSATPPAPAATPPAKPLALLQRGERFRIGDACEWVAREAATGQERGRTSIRVSAVSGLVVRFDTVRPAGIQRNAMGARLRDALAEYDEPIVDLPAEYATGVRWSGRTGLKLHQGGSGVLEYSARVVGRQAVVIGAQAFETWVVAARGTARLPRGLTATYASRLWALPQFGIPLRQEVSLRSATPGQAAWQDEVVECLWVKLTA